MAEAVYSDRHLIAGKSPLMHLCRVQEARLLHNTIWSAVSTTPSQGETPTTLLVLFLAVTTMSSDSGSSLQEAIHNVERAYVDLLDIHLGAARFN